MNIKEFEVKKKSPYELTLLFELYEGSSLDKKAYKTMQEKNNLFAEAKLGNDVFKYNITNKMSLRKYLTLGMDKESMLYIVRRLLEAEMFFNANGINKQYLMYDADLILVDKDNEEITFVAVPATNHGLLVKPLRAFIKEVVANAIYDDEENLDYVGRILTYVNAHKEIYPRDIEDLLRGIEKTTYVVSENEEMISAKIMDTFVGKKVVPSVLEAQTQVRMPVSQPVMEEEAPVEIEVENSIMTPLADERPEEEQMNIELPEISETPVAAAEVEGDIEFPELILPPVNKMAEPQLKNQMRSNQEEQPVKKPDMLKSSMPKREMPAKPQADVMKSSMEAGPKRVPESAAEPMPVSVKKYPYLVRAKTQEIITIDKDEFKIGKITGMADYLLSDNPAVSRMHAIIHNVDGEYYICDNYSTNATYLNGEKLEPGKNYLLINGVKISFANEAFTYLMG